MLKRGISFSDTALIMLDIRVQVELFDVDERICIAEDVDILNGKGYIDFSEVLNIARG